MWFISMPYLFFIIILTITYYSSGIRYRKLLLLSSGLILYYLYNGALIYLIIISILTDYFTGIYISKKPLYKKVFLTISIILNLGLLSIFKYYNFIIDNLNSFFHLTHLSMTLESKDISLPAGISFYTFQTLGYTIDVYRGNTKAERNFIKFALYVTYFPQLIAGPIERANRLLKQLHCNHSLKYSNISHGLRQILWGLFKKLCIANKLEFVKLNVYSETATNNSYTILISSLLFAVQLYCDFSAYCDIALGTSKLFGIKLTDNFKNNTLTSTNIADLWKRWHITLTTWFRDYLYSPLVRKTKFNRYIAMISVFAITGLWHGASWNFVLWGLIQGVIIVIYYNIKRISKPIKSDKLIVNKTLRLSSILLTFSTFSILTPLFCGRDLNHATDLYRMLLEFDFSYIHLNIQNVTIFHIIFLFSLHEIMKDTNINDYLDNHKPIIRFAFYTFLIYSILLFGEKQELNFYYFQF